MTHRTSEPAAPEPGSNAEAERVERRGNLYALEIVFLGVVGVAVALAFVEATTYALVSSRTPLVIMVPLLVLIAIQARRLSKLREPLDVRARIAGALSGGQAALNKAAGFSAWMIGLVAMITVIGQVAGVFAFCVILMRFLAREAWGLTLIVAALTTLFVWGVFEWAFNVELYRGLILRYFLGYRDF